jgi:hypothetical protein
MKQCIIEIVSERFHLFKHDFTVDCERAWNNFLSFIIRYLLEKDNVIRKPTQIIISPATIIDHASNNPSNP